MDGMNPITRKEMFLAAAGGQDVETPTPVTREEAFLDAIVKGGGSSLPSTETASAGDVLSLDDNKEPQWAAPSGGGGGVLVVNETIDGNTHTLDKTYEEIMAAGFAVKKYSGNMGDTYNTLASSYGNAGVIFYVTFSDNPSAYYSASTSTGTLTYESK